MCWGVNGLYSVQNYSAAEALAKKNPLWQTKQHLMTLYVLKMELYSLKQLFLNLMQLALVNR